MSESEDDSVSSVDSSLDTLASEAEDDEELLLAEDALGETKTNPPLLFMTMTWWLMMMMLMDRHRLWYQVRKTSLIQITTDHLGMTIVYSLLLERLQTPVEPGNLVGSGRKMAS